MDRVRQEEPRVARPANGGLAAPVANPVSTEGGVTPTVLKKKFAGWRPMGDVEVSKGVQGVSRLRFFAAVGALIAVSLPILYIDGWIGGGVWKVLSFPLIVLIYGFNWLSIFASTREERAKLEGRPEMEPGMSVVEIVLSRNDVPYAFERGNLSFQEGFLMFVGAFTTFSFARDAVHLPRRAGYLARLADRIHFGPRPRLRLQYSDEDSLFELGIHAEPRNLTMEDEFEKWFKSPKTVTGLSILPPRTTSRSAVIRAKSGVQSAAFGALLAAFFFLHAAASHWSPPGGLGLPAYLRSSILPVVWLTCGLASLLFLCWLPLLRWRRILANARCAQLLGHNL